MTKQRRNSFFRIFRAAGIPAAAVLLLLGGIVSCSPQRAGGSIATYAEAEDPAPDASADWASLAPGLNAAVGSIDRHYFRSAVPDLPESTTWRGSAWQGEKVSAQLVLWSRDPIREAAGRFTEFTNDESGILPSDIAHIRVVRYVITDEFGDGCGHRRPEDYAAFLYPDALDPVPRFDIPGKSARPLWITLDVPAETEPGVYRSTLMLSARGRDPQAIEFELEVLPRRLPPAAEWKFHLDLWQNPYSVARINGVEPWSEAHWKALRPIMKMLAAAGQKVITASITEKPWDGQTHDPFDSMITWTKKRSGDWSYDYSVFDRWVRFMMDLGIDRQINCYSMIPWTSELVYFDEASGREVAVEARPGMGVYTELWTPFLKDFRSHLEEMGWNRITNIAMDERGAEEMELMLKLLDDQAPEFGVALADNRKSYKLYPDRIRDLCVSARAVIDEEDLAYRKSKGYSSTFYVCCGDEFPNTFTFSPPAEAVFIGWYAAAAGFDGFLRWSYCSWVEDPLRDSRFRTWPAGDTYIVYPGARSSIRFERLIEGIQDAEKIRILREELAADDAPDTAARLERLEAALSRFNLSVRPEDAETLLRLGKEVLRELSK